MATSSDQKAEGTKKMVNCPVCGAVVNEVRLEGHIQKVHREPKSQGGKKPKMPASPGKYISDDQGIVVSYGSWYRDFVDRSDRIVGHATSCPKESLHSHVFEDIKNSDETNYYSKDRGKDRKGKKISIYLYVYKPQKDQPPMSREAIFKKLLTFELFCQVCGELIRPSEWATHMRSRHPGRVIKEEQDKYLSQPIQCRGCMIIKFQDIVEHLMDRHNISKVGDIGCSVKMKNPVKKFQDRKNWPVEKPVEPSAPIDGAEKRRKELINRYFSITEQKAQQESDDEPRDGSKYLGFMSREQGRFGSYPLHDNYDDESDAD